MKKEAKTQKIRYDSGGIGLHSSKVSMYILSSFSFKPLIVFPPPQEGANINKSLTTLGKVISALAEVVSPNYFNAR